VERKSNPFLYSTEPEEPNRASACSVYFTTSSTTYPGRPSEDPLSRPGSELPKGEVEPKLSPFPMVRSNHRTENPRGKAGPRGGEERAFEERGFEERAHFLSSDTRESHGSFASSTPAS
jgi:hypothetical protein